MKKCTLLFFSFALLTGSLLTTTGCSKKDNPKSATDNPSSSVGVKMITSLEANTRIYINLTTGEQVPEASINATNWDISFYGKDRNIVIGVNSGTEGPGNAGAQLVNTGFDDLRTAPENAYLAGKEATGDYLKWSNYTGGTSEPKHAVLPKPGMTIAIKTADGKYAKMQILSLYAGNPNTTTAEFKDLATRPAFGYFTFRYATQTNGSRNF